MKKYLTYILISLFVWVNGQENSFKQVETFFGVNKDSTYYYLARAYEESTEEEDWVSVMKSLCYTNEISKFYLDLPRYKASLERQDSLMLKLSKTIDTLPEGKYYKHYYWHNKGSFHYLIQEYDLAKNYFFKVLNSIEKIPDSIVAADYFDFQIIANNYVATIYRNELKYEIAEEFYTENLRLQHKYEQSENIIIDTENLIASLKSAKGDFNDSNEILKKSIKYYLNAKDQIDINSFLSSSALLINNYLKNKQIDSARLYLKKAEPFLTKKGRFTTDFLFLNGKIQHIQEQDEEALAFYKKGLQSLNKEEGDQMVEFYNEIAKVYLKQKKTEKAIQTLNKSIELFENYQKKQIALKHTANNKINILSTLKLKSTALLNSGTEKHYEETIANVFLAIKNINTLKKTFYNESDKQILTENALPIIENGIEASYQSYKNGLKSYVDTAFVFFEQSKSPILLDALYRNNASKFAGVPDSLIEKEKILKLTIANLEKEVDLNKNDKKSELFKLKRNHENLILFLEKNHPSYFQLKYNSKIISLKDVAGNLNKEDGVVSYFYGEKAIYVITLTSKIKKIDKLPIHKKDEDLLKKLQILLADSKSDLNMLNSNSYIVYQKYLKPFLKGTEIKNLLIIPDGLLQSLPLEALNTTKNGVRYVVENINVSYSNSATLLSQLNKKPNKKTSLLAFAPTFINQDGVAVLSQLPNSINEANKISSFFKGKIIEGKNATLAAFNKNLKNYSILHLATHAITNDKVPEYSYLAFSPGATKEHLMYVNDIYANAFNADLVTLSACETGVGQLQRGEGNISLARAFFYSGAQSLVNTLWNITDKSSADIMSYFYEGLSEGKTKNKALRDAKIHFINKNKDTRLTHPYYWSSFIIQGNTQPLVNNYDIFWYSFGGIALCFLLIILFRKKLF